jgi:hypothetical protein
VPLRALPRTTMLVPCHTTRAGADVTSLQRCAVPYSSARATNALTSPPRASAARQRIASNLTTSRRSPPAVSTRCRTSPYVVPRTMRSPPRKLSDASSSSRRSARVGMTPFAVRRREIPRTLTPPLNLENIGCSARTASRCASSRRGRIKLTRSNAVGDGSTPRRSSGGRGRYALGSKSRMREFCTSGSEAASARRAPSITAHCELHRSARAPPLAPLPAPITSLSPAAVTATDLCP